MLDMMLLLRASWKEHSGVDWHAEMEGFGWGSWIKQFRGGRVISADGDH